MQVEQVAVVYARALLEVAAEKGALAETAEEVEFLRGLLAKEVQLRLFIESPRIERSRKRGVLEGALRGKASDVFVNFLLLLIDRGRADKLTGILEAFGKLYDEQQGLVRATVTSAVELDTGAVAKLSEVLSQRLGKRFEITNRVDPEILGGLLVRFDGWVADGSLRTALAALRTKMTAKKFESDLVHED